MFRAVFGGDASGVGIFYGRFWCCGDFPGSWVVTGKFILFKNAANVLMLYMRHLQ